MRYSREHKKRILEWIDDGLPTGHIFDGSPVARIGRNYFDQRAVEQRCRELALLIKMGGIDAPHMLLMEILCPAADDFREAVFANAQRDKA